MRHALTATICSVLLMSCSGVTVYVRSPSHQPSVLGTAKTAYSLPVFEQFRDVEVKSRNVLGINVDTATVQNVDHAWSRTDVETVFTRELRTLIRVGKLRWQPLSSNYQGQIEKAFKGVRQGTVPLPPQVRKALQMADYRRLVVFHNFRFESTIEATPGAIIPVFGASGFPLRGESGVEQNLNMSMKASVYDIGTNQVLISVGCEAQDEFDAMLREVFYGVFE